MTQSISYKEYLKHITTFVFRTDGVLTNEAFLITPKGASICSMTVQDVYALKVALKEGFHVCMLSQFTKKGIKKQLKDLGVKGFHLNCDDKIKPLQTYLNTNHINLKHTLYMGFDLPDYGTMMQVGLPCCPQDGVSEIKAISSYISNKKGGKGAVRDIIEQVLKVQNKWPSDSKKSKTVL